jgi:hypothetical protein
LSTKSFVLATYIVHAILSAVGIGIYKRMARNAFMVSMGQV